VIQLSPERFGRVGMHEIPKLVVRKKATETVTFILVISKGSSLGPHVEIRLIKRSLFTKYRYASKHLIPGVLLF
jgi:hypothetical protein